MKNTIVSRFTGALTVIALWCIGILDGNAADGDTGLPPSSELRSLRGPVIPRIDWTDKLIREAVKELVEIAAKHDPNSPWCKVMLTGVHPESRPVTMHLTNIPLERAFDVLLSASLMSMSYENGVVHLALGELSGGAKKLKVIYVSKIAAERLGMTQATARSVLLEYGIQVKSDSYRVDYDESRRTLIVSAPANECNLAAALVELADRVQLSIASLPK